MKNRFRLYLLRYIMLLTPLLLGACQPAQPPTKIHDAAEILWDTWGIPHIVSPDKTTMPFMLLAGHK